MGVGEGNGYTKEGGLGGTKIFHPNIFEWYWKKSSSYIIFKTKNGGINWKKKWLAKQQYHD